MSRIRCERTRREQARSTGGDGVHHRRIGAASEEGCAMKPVRLMATCVAWVIALTLMTPARVDGQQFTRHAMSGMVLAVDLTRKSVVVSHDSVPGLMAAMTMPFEVRDARELASLVPGAIVSFTLSLSQFRGKVVALNFIYTSCVLPQFCYRVANHFATIRNRFKQRMGRDLVLLTITFDPARDTPERLADYARQWDADPAVWHFLTGTAAEVERVCGMFGVDFFADEGLMSHSVRTAIISRRGIMTANIEGNRYTAAQLGDLIKTALD
jgi:cytochrome oxidase Cu insertion factor (SCO1/SenC/PrrC family)